MAALLLAFGLPARAAGTAAGTQIGNTAFLEYRVPGRQAETVSASAAPVTVARLIGVALTWQDAAAPTTRSPDPARALTFLLTNTGNGSEAYRLARSDAVGGDQFDPQPGAAGTLYLESGALSGFQPSGPQADIPYTPGVNEPVLAADASRIVYVVSDIPAGLGNASTGRSILTASAATTGAATAAPGTVVATADGVPVVAGSATRASATGWYLVAGVSMGLQKTVASVRDPLGGTRVMAGSVLTYRIVLTFTGAGLAEAVALSDPLPPTLRYVPGSTLVDGRAATDAADGDGVHVTGDSVSVDLGNVTAPARRVIEFRTTVQ